MVWSVLALYAVSLGAGVSVIGVLLATYGGTRILLNFPSGIASQRWGRRRIMLMGTLLVIASSAIGALALNLSWLFAAVVLQGIGGAMYVTSALAAAADLGTPHTRVSDMAAYQGAILIGTSIGPAIGGLLAEVGGFEASFLCQGLVSLLSIFAIWRLPGRQPHHLGAQAPGPVVGGLTLFGSLFSHATVGFATIFVRIGLVWTLVPLIVVQHLGLGVGTVGLIITAGAVASLIVLPFAGAATRRIGHRWVVIVSGVMSILALLVLAISLIGGGHGILFVWSSSIILGFASALTMPTITAMVADAVPPAKLGEAMGVMRTATDAAVISAPMVIAFAMGVTSLGFLGGIGVAGIVYFIALASFAVSSQRGLPPR